MQMIIVYALEQYFTWVSCMMHFALQVAQYLLATLFELHVLSVIK